MTLLVECTRYKSTNWNTSTTVYINSDSIFPTWGIQLCGAAVLDRKFIEICSEFPERPSLRETRGARVEIGPCGSRGLEGFYVDLHWLSG